MEEKKNKVSLLSIVLILIMLVLVAGMVYMFLQNQKLNEKLIEKESTISKVESNSNAKMNETETLMEQINQKNNEIKELKERLAIKEIQNNKNTITETEALEIGKKMYKEATNLYLGIVTNGQNGTFEIDPNINIEGKYSKIINANIIKEVFSKNGLFQFLNNNEFIIENDGDYYIINANRGGDITYIDNELKIIDINDNSITFISTEKYNTNEYNPNDAEQGLENAITNKIPYLFSIVKEDGKWKVESYILPF